VNYEVDYKDNRNAFQYIYLLAVAKREPKEKFAANYFPKVILIISAGMHPRMHRHAHAYVPTWYMCAVDGVKPKW